METHLPHSLGERDRQHLGTELAKTLRGEVWFDGARRGIYATDSSNYRHLPLGIVCPRDEQEVAEVLRLCGEAGAPVMARGAGTSLAGQACNVAVVIDMSRHLNAVIEIDPVARTARVQPGVVLDDLRAATERHGLTFGPDPATHAWCTIGGMIGNNACGTHALYAGKTVDNVERLTVLTYGGTRVEIGSFTARELSEVVLTGGEVGRILTALQRIPERYGELIRARYPKIPRRVSGYNLDELLPEQGFHVARSLVGTESTCALIVEAVISLAESPRHRRLVVLGYNDVYTAADHVPALLEHDLLGLEGFDETLIEQMRAARLNIADLELLPPGGGWLIAEVGAADETEAEVRAAALSTSASGAASVAQFSDAAEQQAIWRIRESALGTTARPPGRPPNYEGWEDAAVAPDRLGEYLRGIRDLWVHYGYSGVWYGHFGQGCVHTRNDFDFRTDDGVARYRSFIEQAAELCLGLGGSLSGEHGDGQARGELLEKMFGSELIEAFHDYKAAWDPTGHMNPGKVLDARPLDADLHYGPTYREVTLSPTRFPFHLDHASLQIATERCVGVGRCRRDDTGVMCPSFRATRDEKHSTRGRARLLVEMFQGEATPSTWRNHDVRDALDLCLSCKGCVVDCPTHVDMATYKAEFLSHYYERRLRPRAMYALGLIPWTTRIATRFPSLANAVISAPLVGSGFRRIAGLTTSRPAPRFAPRSFRRGKPWTSPGAQQEASVVIWPDTFSDAYRPEMLDDLAVVLETAGERVAVPSAWACCARPLYDMGMLDLARRTLRHLVEVLDPWTSQGIPVVVIEPSCLAAFRDELPGLLADDPRAAVVASLTRSPAEHLIASGSLERMLRRAKSFPAPGHLVVHPHCHQRATGNTHADVEMLERLGYRVDVLDAGCCGLAGSFGFRAEHADLSRSIGEDLWLPKVRAACAAHDPPAELVMDGFSCAMQLAHLEGVLPVSSVSIVRRWINTALA